MFQYLLNILQIFMMLINWLQIQDTRGKVLITNDGATILKQMEVIHPTAKMVSKYSTFKQKSRSLYLQ